MLVQLGKILVIIGGGIALLGGLLWLSGVKNLPLGRLPGDILIQRDNFTFYFPLATGILLSLGLSAIFWLGRLFFR
jgi:hypothetical protein